MSATWMIPDDSVAREAWHDFQSMSGALFHNGTTSISSTSTLAGPLPATTEATTTKKITDAVVNQLGLTPTENWEFYGFLSLLFPFGLALFRSGLAQRKNSIIILASPFIHLSIGCLMYYFIGYAFANDGSDAGFIGTKYFVPRSHLYKKGYNISLNNWFAQYCVVVACNAVACSGLPESSYLINQVIMSFLVSGFVFPVIAHWTHFPSGWLQVQKFTDFAGAGMLHIAGGTCAFIPIILSRLNRILVINDDRKVDLGNRYLSAKTKTETAKFFTSLQDLLETSKILTSGHNPVLSTLGAFLSLVGFFSLQLVFKDFDQYVDRKFNPNLPIESRTAVIILNSFLSSSFGALTACILTRVITHQWSVYRLFGGALAGLVCASAGLDVYLSWASIIFGLFGGFSYIVVRNLVLKARACDPAETISTFLVPGILSVLSRGVATGAFESEPKIFLWYWAGVTAIFAWSAGIVLIVFSPLAVYLTHTLFVQDQIEPNEGLDQVYMREVVIGHVCKTLHNLETSGRSSKSQLDPELAKARFVNCNPEPTPVSVSHVAPTTKPPKYKPTQYSTSSQHDITAPVLVSSTINLPPLVLKSIEDLRQQRAEKIKADFPNRSSGSVPDQLDRSQESIRLSRPGTPSSVGRTPSMSRTLPSSDVLTNLNKSIRDRHRNVAQMNPRKLLETRLREQVTPSNNENPSSDGDTAVHSESNNLRPKIHLVEDGYTSADSDTNNNPNV